MENTRDPVQQRVLPEPEFEFSPILTADVGDAVPANLSAASALSIFIC